MTTYRAPYLDETGPLTLPPTRRRKLSVKLVEVFIFVAPLLQFVQLRVVGLLFGTDILLLLAFPLALRNNLQKLKQRQVFMIVLFGLAWFVSQVLTDFIRDSPRGDYLRGWSKIALTVTHFLTLWLLINKSPRRFLIYGFGLVSGQLLTLVINPSPYFKGSPWKFGYGWPLTLLVFLLCTTLPFFRKHTSLMTLFMLGAAMTNLFMGARSLALTSLLASVYIFSRRSTQNSRVRKFSLALTVVTVMLSALLFVSLYEHLAENGILGEKAKDTFETQQQGEGGLLLGGRGEIMVSSMAIADSPIIGHGSWARDPKYMFILEERRRQLGYGRHFYGKGNDLIPSHSYIFGAWVEAGVMGAVFWFYILCIVVQTLLKVNGREPILPISIFMASALFWNIFFSPYGATERFTATYLICGVLVLRHLSRSTSSPQSAFALQWAPNGNGGQNS
jgi:hypothetical protein